MLIANEHEWSSLSSPKPSLPWYLCTVENSSVEGWQLQKDNKIFGIGQRENKGSSHLHAEQSHVSEGLGPTYMYLEPSNSNLSSWWKHWLFLLQGEWKDVQKIVKSLLWNSLQGYIVLSLDLFFWLSSHPLVFIQYWGSAEIELCKMSKVVSYLTVAKSAGQRPLFFFLCSI